MNIAGFPWLDEAQERLPRETPALDIERVARANSIKNAIAITAMEGGSPSAFCLDLLSLSTKPERSQVPRCVSACWKKRGVELGGPVPHSRYGCPPQ